MRRLRGRLHPDADLAILAILVKTINLGKFEKFKKNSPKLREFGTVTKFLNYFRTTFGRYDEEEDDSSRIAGGRFRSRFLRGDDDDESGGRGGGRGEGEYDAEQDARRGQAAQQVAPPGGGGGDDPLGCQ